MTDREKLIEMITTYMEFARTATPEEIADHLLANGVTMKERLIEKLVVINKKYGSIRCPSCNAILGASYHYCWQCGQKIIHKLPQSPNEGE